MSDRTPIVWMNVTTSHFWQRPPVGVVRVEQELCNELQKLYGPQLRRCIWQDGGFVELAEGAERHEHKNFGAHLHQGVAPVRKAEPDLIFKVLSPAEALYSIGQGLFSLTPRVLRPTLNRFFTWLRPVLLSVLSSDFFDWRKRRPPALTGDKEPISIDDPDELGRTRIFSPGDILISVGLDWDQPYYRKFYYFRKKLGLRVVTCCYDLIPVIYPQFCIGPVAARFGSYFIELADGSDLILCISEQSEKDLKNFLHDAGAASPDTLVFQLGDSIPAGNQEVHQSEVARLCEEPFVLFVSTVERRKNHEVLYKAYHRLCDEGKKSLLPKMVFVGMKGWGVDDLLNDIALDPKTKDLFVRLDRVSDSELYALYKAALFCVFPSFYEGWGLPVAEALALGKAVICSDKGSLPEVGGDLVVYADPWDSRAWADEMLRMITDETHRGVLEQRVVDNYEPKAWEAAAHTVASRVSLLLEQTLPSNGASQLGECSRVYAAE